MTRTAVDTNPCSHCRCVTSGRQDVCCWCHETVPMSFTYEQALTIAREAHGNQLDKAGKPYIEHPIRVARRVSGQREKVVAILHDVVEDTGITLGELHAFGAPAVIIEAVDAITHRPGEPREDYYLRVMSNDIARVVKLADIEDNVDPDRIAGLEPQVGARLVQKYARAVRALIST